MTDRVPPYSEEGEVGILGSALLKGADVLDICLQERLSLDSFYIPAHRTIFGAMGTLYTEHKAVDVLTVTEHLKKKGNLDRIGGAVFLDRLIDRTPTVEHAEFYIDEVKKAHLRRKMATSAREIESECYTTEEPEDLRSRAESAFTNMERQVEKKSVKRIFGEMKDDIKRGQAGEEVEIGIPTGFEILDSLNEGGMRKAGVYWLSGEEGTGKTSMKCNIILNLLEEGRRIGDLTLEMSVREELEKMTNIHLGTNVSKLIRRKTYVGAEELPDAEDLLINSKRLFINDQSDVSTSVEFWSWARRMVIKNKVDLLCLDYFQLLNLPGSEKMSLEEQTTKKSKVVKDVAGILGVPVLCVAAINKDGKVRGSRLADYDGAGHWQLSRLGDEEPESPHYEQEVNLLTKKARFGVPFVNIKMKFTGLTGKFEELGRRKHDD
jgi:replicative DNA helicase